MKKGKGLGVLRRLVPENHVLPFWDQGMKVVQKISSYFFYGKAYTWTFCSGKVVFANLSPVFLDTNNSILPIIYVLFKLFLSENVTLRYILLF